MLTLCNGFLKKFVTNITYNKNKQRSLVVITLFCLVFGIFSYHLIDKLINDHWERLFKTSNPELFELSCDTIRAMANISKSCFLQVAKNENGDWIWLSRALLSCSKDYLQQLDIYRSNVTEKIWIFLNLKPKAKQQCNVVTLGVSEHLEPEMYLFNKTPECRFFGVDAFYHNRAVPYSKIGRFYPIAVGDKSGYDDIYFPDRKNRSIFSKDNAYVLPLPEIIDRLRIDFIDFLSINLAGYEYRLLKYFERSKMSTEICQMNIEFHSALSEFGLSDEKFTSLISSLIANSPFVPLYVESDEFRLYMFLANLENKFCIAKYFDYCDA